MKRRIVTILMTLSLMLSVVPCECFAETGIITDVPVMIHESFPVYGSVVQPITLEYTFSEDAAFSIALPNDKAQMIYDELLAGVRKIADGQTSSPRIELPESCNISYTAEELGFGDEIPEGWGNLAFQKARVDHALDTMLKRLLQNCPYELYWFDKTEGSQLGAGSVSCSGTPGNCIFTISGLYYSFNVSVDYAQKLPGNMYDPHVVDTDRTAAAAQVMAAADQVVSDNAGKSNYDKLVAYYQYICKHVEYDHDAAAIENYPYGDPWQIISVFDTDEDTNVVCEGYSKAFKYLCDKTWTGEDPAVKCYLASGYMDGGTGAGGHMWNIVTIGGKNYLVDVTNCDDGSVGQGCKLFLCGVQGSVVGGYTATVPGQYEVKYTYDDNMHILFDTELELSATAYDPNQFVPFTPRNLNGDDVVDLRDVALLFDYLSGQVTATAEDLEMADVNGDGDANILDYQALYTLVIPAAS